EQQRHADPVRDVAEARDVAVVEGRDAQEHRRAQPQPRDLLREQVRLPIVDGAPQVDQAQPGDGQRRQRQRPVEAEAQLAPADGLDDVHGCGPPLSPTGAPLLSSITPALTALSIRSSAAASSAGGLGARTTDTTRRRSSPTRGASRSAGATVSKYLATLSIARCDANGAPQ